MKHFRFKISRFLIVSLNIIIQFLLFFWLLYKISNEVVYINAGLRIIAFIFIVFVLTKDMSPSHKIPWIIVLLIFPLLGGSLFAIFGGNGLSKRVIKRFQKEANKSKDLFHQNEAILKQLKSDLPDYYLQAQYLTNRTNLPISDHNNLVYLNDGKVYLEKLLEELNKATRYIFIEYFIINKGKMWDEILDVLINKANQGIEIKILYDDIGSNATFGKKDLIKIREKGIEIYPFNPFLPFLSATHDHRDHRKIVVIDGMRAFTGGINLSDEYVHYKTRFGYWQDSGLFIDGESVHNFTKLFIEMWNVSCKAKKRIEKQIDYYKYFSLSNDVTASAYVDKDEYVLPFGDGPAPYYVDHLGEENFMNMINMAKNSIYILTPYFIIDYGLLQNLKIAGKKGLDIKIILPKIADKYLTHLLSKSYYLSLMEVGVKIYEYTPGFIHNKTCVVDDKVAFLGSINFDYRSLVHHFECGVWLGSCKESSIITKISNDFLRIEQESGLITGEKAKLKWHEKIIRNFVILFASLM